MKKYALLMIFNCLTFFASADFSIQTVIHIASYEISGTGTNIELNNGSIWNYQDTDLFEEPDGWRVGDRVQIASHFFRGYYLENASCQGAVKVTLENRTSPDIQVQRIVEIVFNERKETNTLILEDQTHWFIGPWSSSWMKEWQTGDRILITPQQFILGNAENLLLNLDRVDHQQYPQNVRAQLVYPPRQQEINDDNKREGKIWKLHIESTWQEEENFLVKMDNQTLWRCSMPSQLWRDHDELIILANTPLKIKNLNQGEEVEAALIESKTTLCINQITQQGKKVKLSDGSIWYNAECRGKFKGWQVGDHLVISSKSGIKFDMSSHLMINVDLILAGPFEPSTYAATLVH